MDDRNDNSYTKKTVRKKLVDLKAVAALLEEGEGEPQDNVSSLIKEGPAHSVFTPNEELIQETARIKSQRDLIQERVQKMEQNRKRVSKNVFDKVSRDYAMQLHSISEMLNEKKSLLNKELRDLYLKREKQNVDINRHKEILEEAQFRHHLGEFSEDQYKEVEEYESREIQHLQNEVAKIHTFIKIHEELFDPVDLGLPTPSPSLAASKSQKPTSQPLFKDEYQKTTLQASSQSSFAEETSPSSSQIKSSSGPPRAKTDPFLEKTPLPEVDESDKSEEEESVGQSDLPKEQEISKVSETAPPEIKEEEIKRIETKEDSSQYILDNNVGEAHPPGYFDEISEPSARIQSPDIESPPSVQETSLTSKSSLLDQKTDPSLSKPSLKSEKKGTEEGDSIFDILNDIPLSDISLRSEESMPKANQSDSPRDFPSKEKSEKDLSLTPKPLGPSSPSLQTLSHGYKLTFIEGDAPLPDMMLADNVAIGRSPSNDLVLNTPKVSRQHAAINKYKDHYILIDLKSSNGVYVNGRKVDEHTLEEGDEISIAGFKMIFKKA